MKEYELQKEFEKQEKLKALDEEHRKKYEEELKQQEEKHNKHEAVHHPMNKAQLEEVWEKQDHMEGAPMDYKTFFEMHGMETCSFMQRVGMNYSQCFIFIFRFRCE